MNYNKKEEFVWIFVFKYKKNEVKVRVVVKFYGFSMGNNIYILIERETDRKFNSNKITKQIP